MKIFISYRREDSADVTGRIYEYLSAEFGNEFIFKDVDSIPAGVDFRQRMNRAIAESDVVLAIIGKNWSGSNPSQSRFDAPEDYVRAEVEAALAKGSHLIPVLVHGANMPAAQSLPASMQDVCFLNAAKIRPDPDFQVDIRRLIKDINAVSAEPLEYLMDCRGIEPRSASQKTFFVRAPAWHWIVAGTAAAILLCLAWITMKWRMDGGSTSEESVTKKTSASETAAPPDSEFNRTSGDNSPIVNAGDHATINIGAKEEPKPDYVTDHDGAGAMLMIEPNLRAFLDASIGGDKSKAVGRLINGTGLEYLNERTEAQPDNPPWLRVKVLDGEFAGQTGWVIQSSVRKQ